ncbi:sodium pump decarboxylase subunit gamma [Pseudobacteroides cellulosolvens]|uniref:Uncharacterized protein n=1 Tax=Pseudobacteroides cellulosolvens ATCC 35603 = DSM 2933 TaxID=398512 RepID=A0A0L6JKC1_9FIRM|nr:sodium pump decarboxylase subunit gamma [Pseudobacteroides cellulosolvens]KNY26214.1 hypothetical protein Bccel_1476 [Pseudobacteroides cellulosolvens ATCC 35603 = DSM 2933]
MANKKINKIDDEIVAVISAAIAQMDTREGYRLVVRNIARVPTTSPAWSTMGRTERLARKLNT